MLKKLAIGIGIIAAVILIIAGVGYYLVTRPSDIEKQAAAITISNEAAENAEQKIDILWSQRLSAADGELLSITLTDAEISSSIVHELESGAISLPLDIKNPRIMFVNNKILASGDINVSGFQTNIAIEAIPQLQDNYLKLNVDQVSLGKLPLPDAVVNQIKEKLIPNNEILIDVNEMDIPLNLQDVRIENNSIILTGTAR